MPDFKLPLSGNVSQTINPWTGLFNPVQRQLGLIRNERGSAYSYRVAPFWRP